MLNRSKYLPLCVMFVGLFLFSTLFNVLLYSRVSYLEKCLCQSNFWLNDFEFREVQNEIERLDKEAISVLKK